MIETVDINDICKIELPEHLSRCPVCQEGRVYIDDIDEWIDDPEGGMIVEHVCIDCDSEPYILGCDDWLDWYDLHWSTPYIDWLPLTEKVKAWLAENFRFVDGKEEIRKLEKWNEAAK